MLSYAAFLVIGLFLVEPFYRSQTDIESIITYGKDYMVVVCCFSFGIFTQLMFERMLQATGRTIYTMVTQSVGAVINIILDPILIFGLLGLPKLGVTGAAVATVIGQIAAGVMAATINHFKNNEVNIRMKGFRPNGNIIKMIYGIGVPSIVM